MNYFTSFKTLNCPHEEAVLRLFDQHYLSDIDFDPAGCKRNHLSWLPAVFKLPLL